MRRQFSTYVPPGLCDSQAKAEAPGRGSALFALHCFGCTGGTMLEAFMPVARRHGFILVVPEGVDSSWSAVHCCGTALEMGLDDVGFLRAVKDSLEDRLAATHGRAVADLASRGSTFATGWSNGGYLAMLAAARSGPSPPLFQAIAPISGFQDAGLAPVPQPVPLMMHHAEVEPAFPSSQGIGSRASPLFVRFGFS